MTTQFYIRFIFGVDAERSFRCQDDKDSDDGADEPAGHFLRFNANVLAFAQVASCGSNRVDEDVDMLGLALGQEDVDEAVQ